MPTEEDALEQLVTDFTRNLETFQSSTDKRFKAIEAAQLILKQRGWRMPGSESEFSTGRLARPWANRF